MRSSNLVCALAFVAFGALLVHATPLGHGRELIGAKKCTWGPSYWCYNLTNAKGCNAVRHCIQTVWEKTAVPVDDDSICQICKDMVKQARDQLRSNETMEELKEVFDGSCNLIPIKIVKKECCKLADDFIPELVEALSSQMNPDQVCSVAGLCNNAEIDELLHRYYSHALDGTLQEESEEQHVPQQLPVVTTAPAKPTEQVRDSKPTLALSCGNCQNLGTLIANKFQTTNPDDILMNILRLCGEMSSFSDACANIALVYFNDIYDHLKMNLNSASICHVSGVCSAKYHQHAEDAKEEAPIAIADMSGDDIPCQLCEQLMYHLRDVLVANTTEAEFKQVLQGLCKQTKGFKDECLSIVDQYYDVIYKTLVNNLNASGACFLIGVCPKGFEQADTAEIRPLLPAFPPANIKVTIRKKLGANEPKFTEEELHSMTLPIDHLMGAANPQLLVNNGETCTICEYLLHFIQEELSSPKTDDEIKKTVSGICDKMPNTIRGQCHDFIDMYGDAVIALLVQGLDPSKICPEMRMCPHNVMDMEVFSPAPIESDKPTCPLCLFAVEQAKAKIKDDKSKKHIQQVLDHLCTHTPAKLQAECVDFVETYSNELIDKLMSDFKPQEICVALNLCEKSDNWLDDLGISMESESSSSSEEDFGHYAATREDFNELPVQIVFDREGGPDCLLCEEVIKMAEKKMGKKTSKAEIIKTLDHTCEKLRENIRPKCHKYIAKHGDKIADLILKEMQPKLICLELGFCMWSEQQDLEIDEALKYDVIAIPNSKTELLPSDRLTGLDESYGTTPSCLICEFVMTKLELELKDKTEQNDIKHVIEHICDVMPRTVESSCTKFIEKYANTVFMLLASMPPKDICSNIMLCFNESAMLTAINDEVIECGVCHGATMALLPFFKQHLDHAHIGAQDMINVACENVPAKYHQSCSQIVLIYGPSILNMAEQEVDSAAICGKIGKCFANERSSLAFARITA